MTKAPSFFKFFIAPRNNIDMEIPIAFSRRVEPTLPEKVLLRDRHSNVWVVKLAKVGGSWYFVDGWDKFVEDNSLATGDLLVFMYLTDRNFFHVKLYGPNATEKNTRKQEQISEDDDIVYDDEYDNETESEHCNNINGIKKEPDKKNVGSDDSVFMRCQEYELPRNVNNNGEHQEVTNRHVNKDKELREGVGRPVKKVAEKREVVQKQENSAIISREKKQLIYLYPRCYGMEIFEAGLAEQPTNPYFVAKIMPKRRSDLFIPQDVIKDYNLDLGNEVILVDPTGREFNAQCRKWKDGRSIISRGWRRLCRVNLVSLEDSCICEFVKREGDDRHLLNITFVRRGLM